MATVTQKIEYQLTVARDEMVLLVAGLRVLQLPQNGQSEEIRASAKALQLRLVEERAAGLRRASLAADEYLAAVQNGK